MDASSIQTSLFFASAQTMIASGALFKKAEPCSLASDNFLMVSSSSTTINCQGFIPRDEGARRAASRLCATFSGSIGCCRYFLILLLLAIKLKKLFFFTSSYVYLNVLFSLFFLRYSRQKPFTIT